jgi:hypothetical protein
MTLLSKRSGWFAPATAILDHLRAQKGEQIISSRALAQLEWKWLATKALHGTS